MNTAALLEQAKACEAAGFTGMAKELMEKADRARRLAIAYEKYRYVRAEKIRAFNDKLIATTGRQEGNYPNLYQVFDQLVMGPIEAYDAVPPGDVLEKVKAAKAEGIFDTMEVAKIESTRVYRDPIIFGRINGCTDRFYICQWDDDVKIEDILGPNEG